MAHWGGRGFQSVERRAHGNSAAFEPFASPTWPANSLTRRTESSVGMWIDTQFRCLPRRIIDEIDETLICFSVNFVDMPVLSARLFHCSCRKIDSVLFVTRT